MATKIKINKGDNVRIIAGSQKGTEGSVLSINKENNKAIVEGVNLVKKHTLATNSFLRRYPAGAKL